MKKKPSYPMVRIQKVKEASIVFNPSTGHRLEFGKVYEVMHAPYWRRQLKAGAVELVGSKKAEKDALPELTSDKKAEKDALPKVK
jgi:hypothetical protein